MVVQLLAFMAITRVASSVAGPNRKSCSSDVALRGTWHYVTSTVTCSGRTGDHRATAVSVSMTLQCHTPVHTAAGKH